MSQQIPPGSSSIKKLFNQPIARKVAKTVFADFPVESCQGSGTITAKCRADTIAAPSGLRFRRAPGMAGLLEIARARFESIPDPVRHRKTPLAESPVAGTAMFFFKFSSMLAFDRQACGSEFRPETARDLKTLFGIERVLCDTSLRLRSDDSPRVDFPRLLPPVFGLPLFELSSPGSSSSSAIRSLRTLVAAAHSGSRAAIAAARSARSDSISASDSATRPADAAPCFRILNNPCLRLYPAARIRGLSLLATPSFAKKGIGVSSEKQ